VNPVELLEMITRLETVAEEVEDLRKVLKDNTVLKKEYDQLVEAEKLIVTVMNSFRRLKSLPAKILFA